MEGWQVRQTPGIAQRQKDPNKTDAGSREDRRRRQTGEDAGRLEEGGEHQSRKRDRNGRKPNKDTRGGSEVRKRSSLLTAPVGADHWPRVRRGALCR